MKRTLVYKESGFRLKVTIVPNTETQIVEGNELRITFSWERSDPYFGYNRSWINKSASWINKSATEHPDYHWNYKALQFHCRRPTQYDITNREAQINTSTNLAYIKISEVVKAWLEFHRKLIVADQKLKHFFTT